MHSISDEEAYHQALLQQLVFPKRFSVPRFAMNVEDTISMREVSHIWE